MRDFFLKRNVSQGLQLNAKFISEVENICLKPRTVSATLQWLVGLCKENKAKLIANFLHK